CFFFFFQAEDGIRDGHVTGVQTCALPISVRDVEQERRRAGGGPRQGQGAVGPTPARQEAVRGVDGGRGQVLGRQRWVAQSLHPRSEERRVGKGVDHGGRRKLKKRKT